MEKNKKSGADPVMVRRYQHPAPVPAVRIILSTDTAMNCRVAVDRVEVTIMKFAPDGRYAVSDRITLPRRQAAAPAPAQSEEGSE